MAFRSTDFSRFFVWTAIQVILAKSPTEVGTLTLAYGDLRGFVAGCRALLFAGEVVLVAGRETVAPSLGAVLPDRVKAIRLSLPDGWSTTTLIWRYVPSWALLVGS